MGNKLTSENCLANVRPDLAKEWDYDRNGDLTPYDVTYGTRRVVWWVIDHFDPETGKTFHMPWQESIANRVSFNYGCPYLSGQKVFPGFNDLATKRPDLAAQWHPTKNGTLKPTDVTCGSTMKVWWKEDYYSEKHKKTFPFQWLAKVSKRVQGQGNPFVCGNAVWPGFNDLESNYPEIAAEWDYERNNGLLPSQVTYGTNRKVWWAIKQPHPLTGELIELPWVASINHRTMRKDGCPYLSDGKIYIGFNDLQSTHPILMQQWDWKENKDISPNDVKKNSKQQVSWIKEYEDPMTKKIIQFKWKGSVFSRKDDGSDCPYLSGQQVLAGFNDLQTRNPQLAAEWHPTKNGDLRPSMVTEFSPKKVWWKAKVMGEWYEWEYPIAWRANGGALGIPELKFESKLEIAIAEVLIKHNICYSRQKMFKNCISPKNKHLPYDFFCDNRFLIEGDGIQHFSPKKQFGHVERLKIQSVNDNVKNMYSVEYNTPLLRIPYIYDNKPEKIESFILEFIETKKVPQEILDFYSQFEFSNYVECVQTHEKMQTEDVA